MIFGLRIGIVGVAGLAVVVATVGVTLFLWRGGGEAESAQALLQPVSGLDIVSSGFAAAPPLDEGVRRADLIVEATVARFGSPFWNTPDGERPPGSDREIISDTNFRIHTPVFLDVSRALKGEVPEPSAPVRLNRYGGQVGEDRFVNHDGPYFVEGQRMIVFLRDCGPVRSETRLAQGFRYRFLQRYVIDENGMATGITDRTSIPVDAVLASIEQEMGNPPLSPTPCSAG